jgi:hypothetical protein
MYPKVLPTSSQVMPAVVLLSTRTAAHAPSELITAHFLAWMQIGAPPYSHICAATADVSRHFAEQEVKMIVLFICNEANSQLITEREAIKDALNTCLRPESFMRLDNLKVGGVF